MKLLLAFAVCLELFTSWVMSAYVAVPCTGPEVLAVAEMAINHINKDRKHGYKFAVDRIENAQKQTNEEPAYFLEIDVRETKCHVLSHKPLKNCEIRPFKEVKGDGDCKVLIEATPEGLNHVASYKCEVSPDSVEDVAEKCADCPHLISTSSPEAVHAATVSVNNFNVVNNETHRFDLQEITRSSTKGVGHPVEVEFIIQETTCIRNSDVCTLNILLNPAIGFCTSTVTPNNNGEEVIALNCEIYRTEVAGPEGDGAAPPAAEEEGTAPPLEKGTAPPAVQEEGTAPPAVQEEGTPPPAVEHQTEVHEDEAHVHPTTIPDIESFTQQAEKSGDVPPKRKRSVKKESSESSEELVSSPGKKIVFPDLPADLTTCPGSHKYPEHQ